jgi:hypothetical protein
LAFQFSIFGSKIYKLLAMSFFSLHIFLGVNKYQNLENKFCQTVRDAVPTPLLVGNATARPRRPHLALPPARHLVLWESECRQRAGISRASVRA